MVLRHLARSQYQFFPVDCSSADEVAGAISQYQPAVVIFNWHPVSMPWGLDAALACQVPSIGIAHNYIELDRVPFAVLLDMHPNAVGDRVVGVPRPVPTFTSTALLPSDIVRVGSFGLPDPSKRFDRIIELAHASFRNCVVRFNFAPWDFGNSAQGDAMADRCHSVARRLGGIRLEITRDFMNENQILEFLSSNHINVLIYDPIRGSTTRAIASAPDWMLASGRPMALGRSEMFRHFHDAKPSIFVEDLSLREILANGAQPLLPYRDAWTSDAMIGAFERAIQVALSSASGFPREGGAHREASA